MSLDKNKETLAKHPCDSLEEIFEQEGWRFERTNMNEMRFTVSGSWCDYGLYFCWYEPRSFLYLSAQIDWKLPGNNLSRFSTLIQEINAVMFAGHLEIHPETQCPVWRLGVPCRGMDELPKAMLEDMIDLAIEECERIYPAFQLILWGNQNAQDAAANMLFDCQGYA